MFHYTFGIPPKRVTSLLAHFRVFAPAGNTTVPFEEILQRLQSVGNRVESRMQGSRPRPRTQKKSEAKDNLSEDRPSRGQGQECSRPRPRTKDTAANVLRKKGLQKSFSGNLQFIGVAIIFDWGSLNHKSHEMTSSKICLLAHNQDFAKREGLN